MFTGVIDSYSEMNDAFFLKGGQVRDVKIMVSGKLHTVGEVAPCQEGCQGTDCSSSWPFHVLHGTMRYFEGILVTNRDAHR